MGGKRAPDVTRKCGGGRLRERRDPARKVDFGGVEDFGGSRVTFACQGGRVFGRASKVERVEVKASRGMFLEAFVVFGEELIEQLRKGHSVATLLPVQ